MADDIRVCITGIGAVSPFGRTANDLWAALAAGRSVIARPPAAVSRFPRP